MSITKLYIFSKDTDATESIRGYNYQVLEVVRTWLLNYKESKSDEIHCDFEDDIFENNPLEKTAKFRQIKLYKSNFSFSSEEVRKCIAHFFMLHVKTDYSSFEKEFIFEANSSIAQKYTGNDAELLREWNANQDNPSDDLLVRCVAKVKEIAKEYVKDQTKGKENEPTVMEALTVFNSIQESEWLAFTKCIKWIFKDITPENALSGIKDEIELVIKSLPFAGIDVAAIFGILHAKAWDSASQTDPTKRKLTLDGLQEILTQAASESDKWYWGIFEKWNGNRPNAFFAGEFFEVIDAVRYSKQNSHLTGYDEEWIAILKTYIEEIEIPESCKRTAIYELLWLTLRPSLDSAPIGSLDGCEDYLKYYFSDFNDFKTAQNLEDAQHLLNIIAPVAIDEKSKISFEAIKAWYVQFEERLDSLLGKTVEPNTLCSLLEVKAIFDIDKTGREDNPDAAKNITQSLETLRELLKDTPFYNVTKLLTIINFYIELLIGADAHRNSAIIEVLEKFSEKITPVVADRKGKFQAGKTESLRAVQYFMNGDPSLLLKVLERLYKAKEALYQKESFNAYVIVLQNIAQIYSMIGMNMAAKYFALGSAWIARHTEDENLMRKIVPSYALVFDGDFRQGAWMNAIMSFADYINAHDYFISTPLEIGNGGMSDQILKDFSLILYSMPKISPQLTILAEHHLNEIEDLKEPVKCYMGEIDKACPNIEDLRKHLSMEIIDTPLNDMGQRRFVRFSALGIAWQISFINNYETEAIAEGFCALFQIVLTEVALTKTDLELNVENAKIELEITKDIELPVLIYIEPNRTWKVSLQYFDSKETKEVHGYLAKSTTTIMYVLKAMSSLSETEFKGRFMKLYSEFGMGDKTMLPGLHQRIHRDFFSQERFDRLQRQYFQSITDFSIKSI
jgi:hypothetical protein